MNTKAYKQIKKFIDLYGLPKEIGATGWITEISEWTYEGNIVGQSNEESKGWISVSQKSHTFAELDYKNYWDVDSVYAIAEAFCNNRSDDKQLYFEIHDKEFIIDLYNEDADGKGWEWIGDEDLESVVRKIQGFTTDKSDESYDDFDTDPMDFIWSQCQEDIVEVIYNLPYHICFIEWTNGASIVLEEKKGKIITTKINTPPTKHNVFIALPNVEYFQEITSWLKQNKLEYDLLSKPDHFHTVGFSFDNAEHATMFSLKWIS